MVDFDEEEIFELLLAKGADVDSFGGHTPLFKTVVSHGSHAGSMSYF